MSRTLAATALALVLVPTACASATAGTEEPAPSARALAAADCRKALPEKQVESLVGHAVEVTYAKYAADLVSVCEYVPTKKGVVEFDYDGNASVAHCVDAPTWASYVASVKGSPLYDEVRVTKVKGAAAALTWVSDEGEEPVRFVAARGRDGSFADLHLQGLSETRSKAVLGGVLASVSASRSGAACP